MEQEPERQPDERTDAERFDDAMSAILAAPKDKVEAKIREEQKECKKNGKNGKGDGVDRKRG
jgi:hypothetical protein